MKQLNYFQEADRYGYKSDPTVINQETHLPIWDGHCYERIASILLDELDLDSITNKVSQFDNIDKTERDDAWLDSLYDTLREDAQHALNELWALIQNNPNQATFVHHRDFYVLFDGTLTQELGEFTLVYSNKQARCGSSATFVWKAGYAEFC